VAKDLCEDQPVLQVHLVNYLSSLDNHKGAAQLIADFGLNIDAFPDLLEKLYKSTINSYLFMHFSKRPGQEGYLDLE